MLRCGPSTNTCIQPQIQDGGYHVPFAHKGLASAVDMRTYTSTLHGHRVSIQRCGTGGITGKAGNEEKQQQGASSTQRLEGGRPVAYIFIYPNLMISMCDAQCLYDVCVPHTRYPPILTHTM